MVIDHKGRAHRAKHPLACSGRKAGRVMTAHSPGPACHGRVESASVKDRRFGMPDGNTSNQGPYKEGRTCRI